MKNKHIFLGVISSFLLFGCQNEPTNYEATDANCKDEFIDQIKNKEERTELISKCVRRNNFVPSPPKAW